MVRSLTLLLGGAFCTTVAHAELNLTPKAAVYKADGATFTRLEFSDDGKTVTYQSPLGWEYSGNSTQLTLRPPNKVQVEATITRIPLPQPGNFDEESLKKLLSNAVAQVPKGSENISVVSQERTGLMIQRQETFLITLSYMFYGQKYRRSMLFLNRGTEQIRFQLTCREADFTQLNQLFLASQGTWQNL